MAQKLTLFDLFGATAVTDVMSMWPQLVRPETGMSVNWPPAGIQEWLQAMNLGVQLSDFRSSAQPDRVSIEASMRMDNMLANYPDGFPFVLASMPDVRFLIQHMPAAVKAKLYVTVSDTGAEVVIEGLPVEIQLPLGLLEPHPDVPGTQDEDPAGNFTPGGLDGLRLVLRHDHPTSIFVHVRLHFDSDGEVTVRTAVPVSFGKCTLSGLSCIALHGFELIASPKRAPDEMGWLRHDVTPWAPDLVGPYDGCFSVRTIELDPTQDPIKGVLDWLHRQSGTGNTNLDADSPVTVVGPDRTLTPEDRSAEPQAEFVLDDLVLPFWSPWVVPIPRHITTGVRRRIIDPDSVAAIYAFDQAPVRFYPSLGPLTGIIVESLFYRSKPASMADADIGLTLDIMLAFGGNDTDHNRSGSQGFRIILDEHWTLVLGYQRNYDSTTKKFASAGVLDVVLHFTLFNFTFDIVGIRLGYSFGRGIVEKASFGDSVEGIVDLYISKEPSQAGGAFEMKSLGGGAPGFALEGIGWRLGSLQFSGMSAPDGVEFVFAQRFSIILQEISIVAEQGASYLTFSGGFGIAIPSGFEGGFIFRRLRFRIAGDPMQPPVKMDGFFIFLRTKTFKLEVGGYFTDTTDSAGVRTREFGLTGMLEFGISSQQWTFGLDLIVGNRHSSAEDFSYFFFQMFFRGSIMICLFELRGVRVLFARNMQPKLAPVDKEANQLRYYNWYKASNPLTVSGDRRLAAWQARNDSFAVGLGADGSFAKMGSVLAASVFVLFVYSPDEKGLLVVQEIMLLGSTTPIGYLALEFDFQNGRYSGILGVELTVKVFMRTAPDFIDRMGKLTGTLFIGNDPPTFAIGRLADERTWLQLKVDIDAVVRMFVLLGACIEVREGGPNGFAFVFRMEGTIEGGILTIRYNAGFGVNAVFLSTGSIDYALSAWIEMGIRAIVFFFLRFGLSARAELRVVGAHPTHGEFTVTFRFETPWFLPDVTWTMDATWGDVQVADLASSTQPLLASGGTEGLSQKRSALHVERAVPAAGWDGNGTAPTFTINELRNAGSVEADRLARFEANADLHPVATDTTIAIGFSVSMNDLVGISGTPAPNLGSQSSGDLTLTYELTGLRVRRRSRFGLDRNWYVLEDREELTADFSDPSGVQLSGAFLPGQLFTTWDAEVRVEGQTATKQLLINARTPFEFATQNPEGDEQIVGANPSWPCCHGRDKNPWPIHQVTFRNDVTGLSMSGGDRTFSESISHLHVLRPFAVRPAIATGLPANALVAGIPLGIPGVLWRADLTEDAAFCFVRVAVPPVGAFSLIAFDASGTMVATVAVTAASGAYRDIVVNGTGPIRRLELRAGGSAGLDYSYAAVAATHTTVSALEVEVDRVAYIALADYLQVLREQAACDDTSSGFQDAYSGHGKLFLLPNHEYEITVSSRVTGAHPSRPQEAVDLEEFVYLKTKGFPGLNAVLRVGQELEPYVRTTYRGGRSLLYREEPVALQLSEDYSIALPLTTRPAGSSDERTLLIRMQLLVEPDTAMQPGTVFTATDTDWVVAHRGLALPPGNPAWVVLVTAGTTHTVAMKTTDAFRNRLAGITQRPSAPCALPDPRDVSGTVLLAPPQGEQDPTDPTRQLWPSNTNLSAVVRLEQSGFIDRAVFQDGDETAFDYARDDSAGGGAAWSFDTGHLRCVSGAERRFAICGESNWNHVTMQTDFVLSGTSAGIALALPGGNVPSQGLLAVVETAGAAHRLVIYRRTPPGAWVEQNAVALAIADDSQPITLIVTAFDDIVRATVGETSVEADRNDAREGRLALVAQGTVAFSSLRVRGLSMFAFPVHTSRFQSFGEHVGSWSGRLDTAAPNSLGAGTTTSTVSARWAADAAAIAAAMTPDADPEVRDQLFRAWVAALGLPLKEDLTRVELSRFVESGGTSLILLESPEPIDFTQEVAVTLEKRVLTGVGPLPPVGVLTVGAIAAAARTGGADLRHVRDELFAAAGIVPAAPPAGAPPTPPIGPVIRDVIRNADALTVHLHPSAARSFGNPAGLVFVERLPDDARGASFRVYKTQAGTGRGKNRDTISAYATEEFRAVSNRSSLVPGTILKNMSVGSLVAYDGSRGIVVDSIPTFTWKPIDVRILQDRSGTRAVLIPVNAGAALALQGGNYRLTFTLDRARWDTTEAPDSTNHYHAEKTLSFQW